MHKSGELQQVDPRTVFNEYRILDGAGDIGEERPITGLSEQALALVMSTAVDEVLRNPVARHHLGGMAVNALGGSVFDIAIAVLVLQQTGSVMAMGSIVIMESIPTIFPRDPDRRRR